MCLAQVKEHTFINSICTKNTFKNHSFETIRVCAHVLPYIKIINLKKYHFCQPYQLLSEPAVKLSSNHRIIHKVLHRDGSGQNLPWLNPSHQAEISFKKLGSKLNLKPINLGGKTRNSTQAKLKNPNLDLRGEKLTWSIPRIASLLITNIPTSIHHSEQYQENYLH